MIKSTFYNLPEAKRQRIINAILNEFSNSSSDRVSINRIIKEANISRGSFYQYFDDKVDLVEVLARKFIDMSILKTNKAVIDSNGDIFCTYYKLFDIITNLSNNNEQKIVMKNLIKNLKVNDSLISDYFRNRFKGIAEIIDINKNFNRSKLKFQSDEDIEYLNQILVQVFKNAIFNVFVIGKPCEQVRESFYRKIEIIKSGAIKE